jgi:hypothetical protein
MAWVRLLRCTNMHMLFVPTYMRFSILEKKVDMGRKEMSEAKR